MKFLRRSPWMIGYTFDLCFVYSRIYSSSDHLPLPFHLHFAYGTLSLTPSLLFIRPWTNQHPRPRFKTQYTILGPYSYNYYFFKLSNTWVQPDPRGLGWTPMMGCVGLSFFQPDHCELNWKIPSTWPMHTRTLVWLFNLQI